MKQLLKLEPTFQDLLSRQRFMLPLTEEQHRAHAAAPACRYCNRPFDAADPDANQRRCRDHSHITGEYQGAAHVGCNLQAGKRERPGFGACVPVVFHNFKGYDSHLILQALKQLRPDKELRVLAESSEKLKTLQFGIYRFIDSNALMPGPLAEHIQVLAEEDKVLLNGVFKPERWAVLTRAKGVMPYDLYSSVAMGGLPHLPAKELWANQLTGSSVSDADFARAEKVGGDGKHEPDADACA